MILLAEEKEEIEGTTVTRVAKKVTKAAETVHTTKMRSMTIELLTVERPNKRLIAAFAVCEAQSIVSSRILAANFS